jgi:hypothetical protein
VKVTDCLSANATPVEPSLNASGVPFGPLTSPLKCSCPMTTSLGGRDKMRHESKFSTWIRTGGQSSFVLPFTSRVSLETKFSVVPDRLLDSIIDDALAVAVTRLNQYLPGGVSVDIGAVDLTPIRDQLRSEVAARLTETGVAVDPNDPVIASIIARYAEILNGFLQTEGLQVDRYIWRSNDDSRVRAVHAEYDDHIFLWSAPPEGGHPGQDWNCRCSAEPIIDLNAIPEGATCDILTGDRLATVFPNADNETLGSIARELDLRRVSGKLDTRERLIHFLAQMRQEARDDARLVEGLNYNPQGLRNTVSIRREPRLRGLDSFNFSLPMPRQQLMHARDGDVWKAGKHIGHPCLRVDIIHFCRHDQSIHKGGSVPATL